MNIVKLKDKIKPGDEFFNKYLKGKYAWWVHMRFIIPFEKMGVNGYIACEEDLRDLFRAPYGTEFRDTYDRDMWEYIDQEGTDAANVINKFEMHNRYVIDTDITVDQLKVFRTWLALELLTLDVNNRGEQMYDLFNNTQTYVLQYYASNMYDDVIKKLAEIGSPSYSESPKKSGCGCSGNSVSLINTNTCDPILLYRKDIYKRMVEMFSDIDFWTRFPKEFILEIKKYIDNIIIADLPLDASSQALSDCGCSKTINNSNKDILKRLSEALKFLSEEQVQGRKNYISDALYDWASVLYERMYW